MKVRELKNFLELQMDEARVGKLLTAYAHWISALFAAKEYVVGNPKDQATLRKLEELKLVVLDEEKGQLVARLTPQGRTLYQDFYAHGYF